MTGLDPLKDTIVEIATIITDDDLAIIGEGPDLVIHAGDDYLDSMEEVVRKMHEHSGLLDEIRRSTITLEQAGAETLEFLRRFVPEPRTVPLCGNSIGTDRRFLAVQLPEIDDWLHYRCIDVSTLKELARRWHPRVLSAAPRKKLAHRALGDIKESIAELDYYRRSLFQNPHRS